MGCLGAKMRNLMAFVLNFSKFECRCFKSVKCFCCMQPLPHISVLHFPKWDGVEIRKQENMPHHRIQATPLGKTKSWVHIRLHGNTTKASPVLKPSQKEKSI